MKELFPKHASWQKGPWKGLSLPQAGEGPEELSRGLGRLLMFH